MPLGLPDFVFFKNGGMKVDSWRGASLMSLRVEAFGVVVICRRVSLQFPPLVYDIKKEDDKIKTCFGHLRTHSGGTLPVWGGDDGTKRHAVVENPPVFHDAFIKTINHLLRQKNM